MEFKKALGMASEYFKREENENIACALDAGTHWIFYGGRSGVTQIGSAGIKINQQTGEMEDFYLPDVENFELLDRATPMSIEEGN